jgi:activating signal cointegrator complex subunit 2
MTLLTALLKEKKCLDLPKLLDICAVYVHDNPDLTHHLVSNTFRAQPSYSDDLQAMVLPMLQTIDTMHLRCCTAIDVRFSSYLLILCSSREFC